MRNYKGYQRVLSFLLSFLMAFTSMPITAFATEGIEDSPPLEELVSHYLYIDQQQEFGTIFDTDDEKEYLEIFEETEDELEAFDGEAQVEPKEPILLYLSTEYNVGDEIKLQVNIEDGYEVGELKVQEWIPEVEVDENESNINPEDIVEPQEVEYAYDEASGILTFIMPEFDVFASASFVEKVASIDLEDPSNDSCTHNYQATKTEPTCTSEGFTTYVCLDCGDTYTDDKTDKLQHQYDEFITKEATETENGEKTFTCYLCGDTYTEPTPKIGEEFKNATPVGDAEPSGGQADVDVYIRELSTQFFYGAESTENGNVWTASNYDKGHRFLFRINYAISGVDIAPINSVKFEIPKSILNLRDGNCGDIYEMSIPSKTEIEAYLNGTGESIENDVNWAYYEDGDNIIIYNFRELPAGDNGYIEVSYTTSETTYKYVDMEESEPFTCTMTTPMNTMTADPITVKIDTTAEITFTDKRYPVKHTTWQSVWGEDVKPENDTKYYYLLWTIESYVDANQPYNFILDDSVVGNFEGMEVVGYKFSGESKFKASNIAENQTWNRTRYDYVLTSIPLDIYRDETYWKATNTVNSIVDPIDQVDEDTSVTDVCTWTWTKPEFKVPFGHVNVYKRADGSHRALCMENYNKWSHTYHRASSLDYECSEYTRYDMETFNGYNGAEITNNELDGFKYASWIVGYPYPWTYDTSYNDPKNPEAYGKIPIKYELIDEGIQLTNETENEAEFSEMLTSEDFKFESLGYSWYMTDAEFDDDTQSFKEVTVNYTENDIIIFYGKFGDVNEWVQFASYNLYTGETLFDETYVQSMTNNNIIFKDDVNMFAYKLETTNAHYYTELFTVPHLTLKNSQKVMDYVTDKPAIGILNHNFGNFYEYDATVVDEGSEVSSVEETVDDPYTVMPLAISREAILGISKTDEDGDMVIGATLQLIEGSTGNVLHEWVTDENSSEFIFTYKGTEDGDDGEYSLWFIEDLDIYATYDNFIIHEVSAPEGYELAEDIEIRIDAFADNNYQAVTMVDKKVKPPVPNKLFAELEAKDTEFARISQRYSKIEKDIVSVSNNPKKKTFTISWKVEQSEEMEWGEGGEREYIPQNGGTFYDLLPEGSVFNKNSVDVQVSSTQFLPQTAYTVETIDNYKSTGRTMLIIKIKDTADNYIVYYDTIHPWNSIKDYGNDVYNPVAYETGNETITNGFTDNGGKYFADGTENPEAIKDFAIMSDLNPDSEDPTARKFIYSEKEYDIVSITAASSGLMKKVKAENDSNYSYETTTTINGNYSYQLRYMNSYTSISKNLVLFDSLENYNYDGVASDGTLNDGSKSDWRGILQSIDVAQLKDRGIEPVIYYSTIANLDIETNNDISDTSVWNVLTDSTDLSTVKAIAIDARKTASGEDFVLEAGDSIVVNVHMKAPAECPVTQNDYTYTYNNIYISNTIFSLENPTGQDFLIHQDYTAVKLIVTGSFGLEKVSSESDEIKIEGIEFRLVGTSNYGTEVDEIIATDVNGQIYFEDIEMGTYILQECKSTDDWILDTIEHKVVIDGTGKVWIDDVEYTEIYFKVQNKPRVHGNLEFFKKELGEDTVGVPNTAFSLEGISDYGTEVSTYATSLGNGKVQFLNVEQGTYQLKEIFANPNYEINNIVYTVNIDDSGNATIVNSNEVDENGDPITLDNSEWFKENTNGTYFIYNRYKYYEVELRKVDAENSTMFLEGAVFSLTGVSNSGIRVELEASSNQNGLIAFNGIEAGNYVLKELEAPKNLDENGNIGGSMNYLLDETEYVVKIAADGTVSIEGLTQEENTGFFIITNARAYDKQIIITKIWEDGLTNEERVEQGIIPKLHLTNRDLSQDENFHTHTWDEGEVLSVATCTENGETLYTCTDCTMTNVQKSAKLEHEWDEGTVISEATCCTDGKKVYYCEACGTAKSEVIEKLDHTWANGIVASVATCTADGARTYTCTTSGCGETKTEVIPMIPHDFSNDDGTCSVCGAFPYLYSNVVMTGEGTATVYVSNSDYDYYASSMRPYYSKIITFVPTKSGTYTFTASASVDSFGRLYNSEMTSLKYDDSSGGGSDQFKITYTCTAGEIYYLAAGYYNSSKSGDIPVTIVKTS